MLKVLIADNHTLVREGIQSLLDSSRFEIIGEASSGQEAVTKSNELNPDIILMEMNIPEKNGLEAAREIIGNNKNAKVVMLGMEMTEAELLRAVDISVKGCLLKNASKDMLNNTLSLVANGESVFPSETLVKSMNNKAEMVGKGLTEREGQILRHIAKGMSNKEIAIQLSVMEGTVKVHIKAILKKLGMNNRTQAAVYAHEKGFA